MDTAGNSTVREVAHQLYRTTLEDYRKALRSDTYTTFCSFCRSRHVSYDGIKKWASAQGISIMALKWEARGEVQPVREDASPSPTFIQFVPSPSRQSPVLRNVSITFPDGVNLTLQESGVTEVMALLDAYRSRHQAEGGAASCSR